MSGGAWFLLPPSDPLIRDRSEFAGGRCRFHGPNVPFRASEGPPGPPRTRAWLGSPDPGSLSWGVLRPWAAPRALQMIDPEAPGTGEGSPRERVSPTRRPN